MSTDFIPSKRIAFARIRNFNHNGITVWQEDGDVLLTDGTNYLWVDPPDVGIRITFSRCGVNDVMRIIEVLEDYFHVRIISEYNDEFHDIIKADRSLARRRKKARKSARH